MPSCPNGHETPSATGYCDTCGSRIEASPTRPQPPPAPPPVPEWECPRCHRMRAGRFCELDGYDSMLPPTAETPTRWELIVIADRKYYEFVQNAGTAAAASINFPEFCPERRFRLHGKQMLIGRRSPSRGINPEIDLIGPPEDPAVGHAHALLVAQPDHTWALVDLHSVNGSFLNYSATPVEPDVPAPLTDGDRVHVGGWTTLTVRAIG